MGAIGGLLGTAGGANGTGFAGPSSANVLNPSTVAQANTAYNTAQGALGQQQNFVNALGAQNGIQNQSSVFNQLQGVANGTGPNPAQAQLAQATGANTANQAALMAGQRGAGANVGLIARQAAQQGAANQQQSAGQAASLQANQSLNALSGLGNLATQQVGQQQQGIQGLNTASQGEQNNILNGIAGQNNANVGMQSNVNSVNGQLANTSMQGQQAMIGGMMPSAGSIMSMLAAGGKVRPMYDEGGSVGDEGASSTPNTSVPTFGGDSGASALGGGKSGGSSGGGLLALLAPGGQVPRQYYANQGNVTAVPQAGVYGADPTNDPNSPFNKQQVTPAVQVQAPAAAVPESKANPKATPAASPKSSNSAKSSAPAAADVNYGNPGANALYKGMSQAFSNLNQSPTNDSSYKGTSSFGNFLHGLFSSNDGSDQATQDAYAQANKSVADGGVGMSDPNNIMKGDSGFNPEVQAPASEMPTDNSGNLNSAKGGKVPAMVSPGERYLPPKEVAEVKAGKKSPMEAGEKIPGKPKVGGAKNDYANDTVPKTLEEGGLVLPRSVTQSKSPHWAAMRFVQQHMAQGGKVLPQKPKSKK